MRNVNRQLTELALSLASLLVRLERFVTARAYAFKIEDSVALARQHVTRSLTEAEWQQCLHVATYPGE